MVFKRFRFALLSIALSTGVDGAAFVSFLAGAAFGGRGGFGASRTAVGGGGAAANAAVTVGCNFGAV